MNLIYPSEPESIVSTLVSPSNIWSPPERPVKLLPSPYKVVKEPTLDWKYLTLVIEPCVKVE